MWVRFKKTCVGKLGSFHRGQKYDLPKATIDQLPKKSYVKTCAPWDEQKDEATIAKANLLTEANNAIAAAEKLVAEAEQAKKDVLAFNEPLGAARDAARSLKGRDLKDRAAQKIGWQLRKAEGRYEVLGATAALKQLEAEDAVAKATELAEKAGIEWPPKDSGEDAGVPEGQAVSAGQAQQ